MEFIKNAEQNPGTAAEGEKAGLRQADQAGEQTNTEQHELERTFTQDEVNDIVQKRLAKERERLSKVFQEEKQLSELEERERNILKRELKADAIEELNRQKLPPRLAELLDYSSEENLQSSMKEVISIFKGALGERLKPYARQTNPFEGMGGSGINTSDAATRKAFKL